MCGWEAASYIDLQIYGRCVRLNIILLVMSFDLIYMLGQVCDIIYTHFECTDGMPLVF